MTKAAQSSDFKYQANLFLNDLEAEREYEEKLSANLGKEAFAQRRKEAWEAGSPFPEDSYRYYGATNAVLIPSPLLPFTDDGLDEDWIAEWYRAHPKQAEFLRLRCARARDAYLTCRGSSRAAAAKGKAKRLGVKIGKRRRLLRIYSMIDSNSPVICYWCKRLTDKYERQVDHIYPLAKGGTHTPDNLCITCTDCNLSKSDLDPGEFFKQVAQERALNIETLREIGGMKGKSKEFWANFFEP